MRECYEISNHFDILFWSLLRTPDGRPLEQREDGLVAFYTMEAFEIRHGIPRFAASNRTASLAASAERMNAPPLWKLDSEHADFLSTCSIILDAGCGLGWQTIQLAELAPKALVVGLDTTDAVYEAKKNAKGLPNIRFIQGDLCAPPLLRKRMDYIRCPNICSHTTDPQRAISALASLLKKDGKFDIHFASRAGLQALDYTSAEIRTWVASSGLHVRHFEQVTAKLSLRASKVS